MKELFMEVGSRRSFLCGGAAFAAAAVAHGAAAPAKEKGAPPPVQGKVRLRRTGMGIAGVVVSDGLNCVRTAKDGTFELPGRAGAHLIEAESRGMRLGTGDQRSGQENYFYIFHPILLLW